MIKVFKIAEQPITKTGIDLNAALDSPPRIFDAEQNAATELRRYFERGELPFFIVHASKNRLAWKFEPVAADFKKWLPIFIDGLKERTKQLRFIAENGCIEMIKKAGEMLPELIPAITLPAALALRTRDVPTMRVTVKILTLMLKGHPRVAEEMLPYINRILRPLFLVILKDSPDDLSVAVNDMLSLIEDRGGDNSVACIKYSIPIFDGQVNGYDGSIPLVKIPPSAKEVKRLPPKYR